MYATCEDSFDVQYMAGRDRRASLVTYKGLIQEWFFFLLFFARMSHMSSIPPPSPENAFRMHWNMFIFIEQWSGLVPKSPRDARKGCWHGRHVPRPRAARYTTNDPLGTMWEYNGRRNVSLTG